MNHKSSSTKQNTTIVIGGGWSGLAAAVTLAQQGHHVHLIEAAKQLGGRARNVTWKNITIDNGQHLMIGAYHHMLAMMKLVGIDTETAFHRQSIDIELHDPIYPTLYLSAHHRWLPWPLSLAWNLCKSAGLRGLYHVGRIQSSTKNILSKKDITVSEWLLSKNQPTRLIKQLWEPLCLATLNTPIDEASAHLLAKVLQDSLGKGKSDADSLIPTRPLGDMFPNAAAMFIKANGGSVSLKTRAKQLIIKNNTLSGLRLQDGSELAADNIIVATSPSQTYQLLAEQAPITKFTDYPISTVYLQYAKHTRLNKAMIGLTGTLSQWVFDRSEQSPGLMAVVISGPGNHESLTNAQLVERVKQELQSYVDNLANAELTDSLVIREKRATFASIKNIEATRPISNSSVDGLWLTGDFIANAYPATLEGAILNGQSCAHQIIAQTSE